MVLASASWSYRSNLRFLRPHLYFRPGGVRGCAGSVFQGRGCYATAPASEGSADATWTEIAIWAGLVISSFFVVSSVSSLERHKYHDGIYERIATLPEGSFQEMPSGKSLP